VRKIEIALDCDGVLSDFTSGALRVVEEITGRRYEPVDVGEFDFTKALDLSACEARAVKEAIGSRRGFCASLAPYPKARQGVRRLRELGDVFCVTSPWDTNSWWRAEREAWLALHFGIDRVHHAEDKSTYAADVFVDDRSKHVRAWFRAWPERCAVFWRTMHNTAESVPWGAWSISSWDALYDVAREVALGPVQQTLEVAP
jgi:5'(3')-deoxyribonucleotidase